MIEDDNISVPSEPEEKQKIKENIEKSIELDTETVEKMYEYLNSNNENLACDVNNADWVLEEKCKLIDNIKTVFKRNSQQNWHTTKTENFLDLLEILNTEQRELLEIEEQMTEDLQRLQQSVKEKKDVLHIIKMNEKSISTSDNNDPEYLNLDRIDDNSKKIFFTLRKDLKNLLEKCYNSTSLNELIQNLTVAYFKGGDAKYIDISDGYSFHDIELLKEASLIVEDPYNKFRIKFDDFA